MNLSKEVTKALKTVGCLPDVNGTTSNEATAASEAVAMDCQPGGSTSKSGNENALLSQEGPQPGPSGVPKPVDAEISR